MGPPTQSQTTLKGPEGARDGARTWGHRGQGGRVRLGGLDGGRKSSFMAASRSADQKSSTRFHRRGRRARFEAAIWRPTGRQRLARVRRRYRCLVKKTAEFFPVGDDQRDFDIGQVRAMFSPPMYPRHFLLVGRVSRRWDGGGATQHLKPQQPWPPRSGGCGGSGLWRDEGGMAGDDGRPGGGRRVQPRSPAWRVKRRSPPARVYTEGSTGGRSRHRGALEPQHSSTRREARGDCRGDSISPRRRAGLRDRAEFVAAGGGRTAI